MKNEMNGSGFMASHIKVTGPWINRINRFKLQCQPITLVWKRHKNFMEKNKYIVITEHISTYPPSTPYHHHHHNHHNHQSATNPPSPPHTYINGTSVVPSCIRYARTNSPPPSPHIEAPATATATAATWKWEKSNENFIFVLVLSNELHKF